LENPVEKYIDAAVELELLMADLYGIFSEYLEADRHFWYKLGVEEKNHAALLKTAKEFIRFDKLPAGLLPDNPDVLEETHYKIRAAMDTFIEKPQRELAFRLAYALENSAGEIHFQHFMKSNNTGDRVIKIFHDLNQADKDHSERILKYWEQVIPGRK
jgi:hypothetical protein